MVAILVTGGTAWVAYHGVRHALEGEFERRLERIAATAAGQIGAAEVADARLHEEGGGYGAIQVQLVTLRSATGVENAALVDPAGITLVDARAPAENEGLPSALDSLAHAELARALAGHPAVSAPYRRGGRVLRVGFAPVADEAGRVAGAVAIEAEAAYFGVAAGLFRTLTVIALVSLLAIAVLAALFVRLAGSASRLERQLSRSENLAAMGRLTATLAHEIKNPLAIIRGSAQRLGKLDPEAARMAEYVIEESDRLSKTVARYLQFARGEPAARERGDAVAMLEATLDLLEGEFAARKVTLERAPGAPAGVPVGLDNESLKQVYLNLILNALEAMPDGGRIQVGAVERHGRIEVRVADDGPGIPAETLKKLGHPFVTTKAQGSGLGLFLTRRLVRSAGGALEIRSEVGRGTTCTVRFARRKG